MIEKVILWNTLRPVLDSRLNRRILPLSFWMQFIIWLVGYLLSPSLEASQSVCLYACSLFCNRTWNYMLNSCVFILYYLKAIELIWRKLKCYQVRFVYYFFPVEPCTVSRRQQRLHHVWFLWWSWCLASPVFNVPLLLLYGKICVLMGEGFILLTRGYGFMGGV